MEIANRLTGRRFSSLNLWILVVVFLPSIGCSAREQLGAQQVSLVDLLAEPTTYVGERVSIMGYLAEHINLELFPSRQHSVEKDHMSSLVVADYDKGEIYHSPCVNNSVEIIGEVAHGSAASVVLVDVTTIKLIATNEVCWELE